MRPASWRLPWLSARPRAEPTLVVTVLEWALAKAASAAACACAEPEETIRTAASPTTVREIIGHPLVRLTERNPKSPAGQWHYSGTILAGHPFSDRHLMIANFETKGVA